MITACWKKSNSKWLTSIRTIFTFKANIGPIWDEGISDSPYLFSCYPLLKAQIVSIIKWGPHHIYICLDQFLQNHSKRFSNIVHLNTIWSWFYLCYYIHDTLKLLSYGQVIISTTRNNKCDFHPKRSKNDSLVDFFCIFNIFYNDKISK